MPAAPHPPARLRRGYFDCRFGQLHVHLAIPAGGGFDEALALLCLPGAGGLGSGFRPLLAMLGANRSIYAPDLPGHGQSDPAPAGIAPVQAAAQAALDLLDSLRERRACVLAEGEGGAVAASLVAQRPGLVQCLALAGRPGDTPVPAGLPGGLPVRSFELGTAAAGLGADLAPEQSRALAAFLDSARR